VLRLHGPQLKAEFTPATGGRYTRWAVVTTTKPYSVKSEILTASVGCLGTERAQNPAMLVQADVGDAPDVGGALAHVGGSWGQVTTRFSPQFRRG